jgi:hypothetical protein
VIDDEATQWVHDSKATPPVTVTIYDSRNPAPLELYFEHPGDNSPFWGFKVLGDGPLDLSKVAGLARRLPHYVDYGRAIGLWNTTGEKRAALEALRTEGSTRGLPDRHYRAIADEYVELVQADDPHPIKTIAQRRPVDNSRASRWVSEARNRGYISDEGKTS